MFHIAGRLSAVDIAEVNPAIGTAQDVETTVKNTIEFVTRCFGKRRQGVYPADYNIPIPK